MKTTGYDCDRCYSEGNERVPAPHKAWIRTTLGGRTIRLDVCDKHLAVLVGSNGPAPVAPTQAGPRVWPTRQKPGKEKATYDRLVPFIAKQHTRFSIEEVFAYVGKDVPHARTGKVLRLLVEDGRLERYVQGIYQPPGHTIPAPESAEVGATLVLKAVKAHPGMRATLAAALAGIDRVQLWRATLGLLRERKLARTKGYKSAMRLYPL